MFTTAHSNFESNYHQYIARYLIKYIDILLLLGKTL